MAQDSEYLARFLDGPLAEQSERRALTDGATEERIDAIALDGGIEATFRYARVAEGPADGDRRADYRFDATASDPVQTDRDEESIEPV